MPYGRIRRFFVLLCLYNFIMNQYDGSFFILCIVPVFFVVYAVMQQNVGHMVGHTEGLYLSPEICRSVMIAHT